MFCIDFTEAVSVHTTLPATVSRIILSFISIHLDENLLTLSEEHKSYALTKLSKIKAEVLFEYMDLFDLRGRVNPEFITEIINEQISQSKWNDSAVLITVGKLQS
jgi:hypothetical protein